MKLIKDLTISFKIFTVMVILTGVIYTAITMLLGNLLFPSQVKGSLIIQDNKLIGSRLIAQKFSDNKYFWARPSACDYNTMPSSASNLAPTSKNLQDFIKERTTKLTDSNSDTSIPIDLLSASASGIDPEISPAAAYYQMARVAQARGLNEAKLKQLITQHILKKDWGIFGEDRVNVLELNLSLDQISDNE